MRAFITLINTTSVPTVWILSIIGISLFLLTSADIIDLEVNCFGDTSEMILHDIKFRLIPAIVLTIAPYVLITCGIAGKSQIRIAAIIVWYLLILVILIIARKIYLFFIRRDD